MKMFLQSIYNITFIFLYFPMFVIYFIPGTGNGNLAFGLILSIFLYLILIITKPILFLNYVFDIFKNVISFRIYCYFIIFVVVTMFIQILIGKYTAPAYYYAIRLSRFFLAAILVFFLPALSLYLKLSVKYITKLFIITYWGMLCIGIIQYFSLVFNLSLIQNIIKFFTYARTTLYTNAAGVGEAMRIHALFDEPSGLGLFIFIMMPLLYNLSKCNFRIFKNKTFDLIIKKTMLPFTLIVIIFTKSPIYLIFCFIEYIILSVIYNKFLIKKYFFSIVVTFIVIIAVLSILSFTNIEHIEQSYLSRILKTIDALGNFNKLVNLEPSLATRIVSYSAQVIAFTKNILFGCGLYNVEAYANSFYLSETPLPLTYENYYLGYLIVPYVVNMNKSIIYTGFAEFGCIGMFIYFYFIYKNYCYLDKISKIAYGMDSYLIKGIKQSIISIIIISFYNLYYTFVFMWLILGLGLVITYIYKKRKLI